jgi:hypothetical protein
LGDKLGDKKEDQLRDKLGDKGDKTAGRRTYHPTQNVTGTHVEKNRKQGETRPWEMGYTVQHRHIYMGRQWETKGDKTSGRRAQHPTQAHVWETMGYMGR